MTAGTGLPVVPAVNTGNVEWSAVAMAVEVLVFMVVEYV